MSENTGPRYSWNQAVCTSCWYLHNPARRPATTKDAPTEKCVFCGGETTSGIYIRIDPKTAPFPAKLKED